MKILDEIGEPAMLEQLAEEASELAQAALKLARKERGDNPTPKTKQQCVADLLQEIADVKLVMSCLQSLIWFNDDEINRIKSEKLMRWIQRLKEAQKHQLYWKHVKLKNEYGRPYYSNLCSNCNHAQRTITPYCGGCGKRIRGAKDG